MTSTEGYAPLLQSNDTVGRRMESKMLKLSGAQVTRINEELVRLDRNARLADDRGYSFSVSLGDRHRAIEDFVDILMNDILLTKTLPTVYSR